MFNHKNTPSSFLRKKDGSQGSHHSHHSHLSLFLSKESEGAERENIKGDVDGGRRSSISLKSEDQRRETPKEELNVEEPEVGCDGGREEGCGYKTVSVSTRWSWEDIFTTTNTTHNQGTTLYRVSKKWKKKKTRP